MKKLSKEYLGLAGEYAVATELARRDVYPQLTMGHHKKTDIIVETETNMAKIQVKAKQDKEWPKLSGISREKEYLVLVDFYKKDQDERPDFYVLNINNWKTFIEEEREKFPDLKVDDNLRMKYPDGWSGLNLNTDRVKNFREKWDNIISTLND